LYLVSRLLQLLTQLLSDNTMNSKLDIKSKLLSRLHDKQSVIGVVGLGYVGLPLILRFAEAGLPVLGIDIDQTKVDKLNRGESYFKHIVAEKIKEVSKKGPFATVDFSRASEADVLILCVPTPLSNHREPDLSFVTGTLDSLLPYIRQGQVISLESTTYPGTTEEIVLPKLQSIGLSVGEQVFLVYSPEREDPGNPNFDTRSIPKVCGGHTANCLEVGSTLYSLAIDTIVEVTSTKVAEMTKLLENIHRAVNIGLVNEMKIVADKMDINIHEVIEAAKTKPFGFTAYYPGPGLGGHCIPIDPFYLTWKAREYGINTRFIELAGEVNTAMPQWVVEKTLYALNDVGKPMKGARILVLGIAYKKNVDDMRESPSVVIIELLRERGAKVNYHDPFVPVFPRLRGHYFDLESIALNSETIGDYDAILIATDHDTFDYELIRSNASLIIDTRGTYKDINDERIINA